MNEHSDSEFSSRVTSDGRVFVHWRGKLVKTLKGSEASSLVRKLESADPQTAQLILAKITGNFKRGNERRSP